MVDASGSVGIVLAFGAGMLSFLSPCVLPLVPGYLTFLTGLTLEDTAKRRHIVLVHALLFVAGFSLVFLAMGATATVLGRLLLVQRAWITRIGGALIIVFGLYLLGVFNFAPFMRERRLHLAEKPVGFLGTVFVGATFAAGWTPCIGPVLSAILVYAGSEADVSRGLALLGAYSAGLALPFLGAAWAVESFFDFFARIRKRMVWVNRISGAMLVTVGVLMVTSQFTVIAGWLDALTPEFLRSRL